MTETPKALPPCPKCKVAGSAVLAFNRKYKDTTISCSACGFKLMGFITNRAALQAWNEAKR